MIRFAEEFINFKIVAELVPQKNYAVKSSEKPMDDGK
jgi:hypothetical protein